MASPEDTKEFMAVAQLSGGDGPNIATQDNASPRGNVGKNDSTKNQVRHRASVACVSCRDRRIRCVVPAGHAECNHCRKTGTECIIKNDDERRRPISKAYMSSLSDRITMLEDLLIEKGIQPPPANHPPKTRNKPHSEPTDSQVSAILTSAQDTSSSHGVPTPPGSRNEDFPHCGDIKDNDAMKTRNRRFASMPKKSSPFRTLDAKQDDIVHWLLATTGNLSFDQLAGGLRYFGPIANSHVYADSPDQLYSREPTEKVRRAERIIRSLTTNTYDYLMNHFWEYYNSVLHIIDRECFEADRGSHNPSFYSPFLHITMLAMGYRGADMNREDMKAISLGNRESTLHREAKRMLDVELERPGGIPSVQALLLLSDLECGVGRDHTGWMYSGMANRLAFDIGLHLDCRTNGMAELEIKMRHMVMRACAIYDKYWALFLGRPTSIKSQDVGIDLLQTAFSQPASSLEEPTPAAKDVTGQIYEQLLELMDLAGRIVDIRDPHYVKGSANLNENTVHAVDEAEEDAYLHVVNLDRQLQSWYRRLPDHLAWRPANVKTVPYSYFLLHQQYHVAMILLHRPWAKYGVIAEGDSSTGSRPGPDSAPLTMPLDSVPQHPGTGTGAESSMMDVRNSNCMKHDSRTRLARSVCTHQAIRVAQIFWQHRQRFDGRRIFVTGIQHAGTAALALIAALTYQHDEADCRTYLGYLEVLSDAVNDMSHTYQPAARMDGLLKAVLAQIRASTEESLRSGCSSAQAGMSLDCSSGSGSQVRMSGASDVTVPVVPSRREADSDFANPSNKRRHGSSRPGSGYAHPSDPFFSGLQATPPQSFAVDLHQQHNLQTEQPMMLNACSVDDGQVNANFTRDSAAIMDAIGEDQLAEQQHGTDLNLVSHGSGSWDRASMHLYPQTGHHTFNPYSSSGENWDYGPRRLRATSVLGQSAVFSKNPMSASGAVCLGDTPRAEDDHDRSEAAHALLNGSIGGMSSTRLSGLVQSVEEDGGGFTRNHELDYFSFT